LPPSIFISESVSGSGSKLCFSDTSRGPSD
jgi:hypothetical protein